MEACLEVIGGKWKGLLLHQLIEHGTQRFGELIRLKPNLSARILSVQLQELEEDGIVFRQAFAVVPPKVEYSLTEYGKTLVPLIEQLQTWGDRDRIRRQVHESPPVEVSLEQQESVGCDHPVLLHTQPLGT